MHKEQITLETIPWIKHKEIKTKKKRTNVGKDFETKLRNREIQQKKKREIN